MTDVVFLEDTIFYKKGSVVQLSDADLAKYEGKGLVEVLGVVAGVADVPAPVAEDEPVSEPVPTPTPTRSRKQ